eukprot:CAMPEP_0172627198 /NCGR_PEP_ID=MMETSP1068-20121228/155008_1 /TAXON_ID=35684 /ORGANISM="Pseudopedinella elastica, Strain CCMP716" /LENGTH=198 /DNA_ID=CAMNT_0013437019 /DNA_START=75 /DNA_END=672 /DNA_ORIENTATION=-
MTAFAASLMATWRFNAPPQAISVAVPRSGTPLRVELSAVRYDDGLFGLPGKGALAVDLEEHGHRLLVAHSPEDHVPVVHPLALDEADVEARAVIVRPRVDHRHHTRPGVPQNEVLVLELLVWVGNHLALGPSLGHEHTLAPRTVVVFNIPALTNLVFDYPVEWRPFVVHEREAVLVRARVSEAKGFEVFACLWAQICT